MKRALLINPWIHDFAAFNLWSAPLGLYKTLEFLSRYDIDLHLLDCTDAPVKEKNDGRSHIRRERINKPAVYKSIPRYYYRFGISQSEFRERVSSLLPIDAFLVSSQMSYWYPGVAETIHILKELSPKTPVILGGIYATLYSEHAKAETCADHVFTGPVSERLNDLLRSGGSNAPRHWSEFVQPKKYAPILTSYGCPMRCTYCASHILNPKFTQRSPVDVSAEITLLYSKGIRHFAFYDDALLVNAEKHLLPILRHCEALAEAIPHTQLYNGDCHAPTELAMTPRFYTPVGLQARLITKDVARALKRANFGYLRIGLETTDPKRQKATGGKILGLELETAVRNLKDAGFKGEDIGVFIMYGLPGQEMAEVVHAIGYAKSLGVNVALTEYSPIHGTKEFSSAGIDLNDPLLANNTAYSRLFTDFKGKEIEILKELISRP